MVRKPSWVWVRAPRGPIPKAVQDALRARLEHRARTKWKKDPHMPWHTPEQRARIAATPVRLCRLGYLGGLDRWQYAFYTYSDDKYALSVVASGPFEATTEQAVDCAARVYLCECVRLGG